VKRVELWQADGGACAEPVAVAAGLGFCFSGDGEAKRGIADDERGVRLSKHRGDVRFGFTKFRRDIPAVGTENSGESLRAARTAVERDAFCKANGIFGDEEQAADAFFRGDGEVRQNREIGNALIFDGGNDGDICCAGAQRVCAERWNREGKVVFALQRAVGEAANERGSVQILHDGDAKFVHAGLAREN